MRESSKLSVGAIALSVASSGCSLLLVDGPPPADVRPTVDFVCTTSQAAPVLDGLAAPFVVAHEVGGLGTADSDWSGVRMTYDHRELLAFGVMTALAASAIVGMNRVQHCREATAAARKHSASALAPTIAR